MARIVTDPSVDFRIRSSAVWVLGRLKKLGPFKKADALQPLLVALADSNHFLRGEAARSLGVLRDTRATARLIQVMRGDLDAMVRQSAAQALGSLGRPKAIRALREVIKDQGQDSGLRGTAAEALGSCFAYESAAELVAGLSDLSPEVRFWSAYALGAMKVKSAVAELKRLAAEDDAEVPGWWSVSREAARAIAEIRGEASPAATGPI
ncbi:MAG TPA: HEAT repeat domain-containing protein [Candidatus Dormibacteraeota bacterium]|nr:HEAT repeat domain-containing protein [Candidatus Dormibacteraeota bacterium]